MKRVKLTRKSTVGMSMPAIVCEQVLDLSKSMHAQTGLERLVTPQVIDEEEDAAPNSRAAIGSTLRSLNAEMLEQINELAKTATALLAADTQRRTAIGNAGTPPPLIPPPV